MNLGLRCGLAMAERNKGLNFAEKDALWYRLERIGAPPRKPPEPKLAFLPANRQWDMVLQLKAEVVGWREKHSKILLEVDTLKEKLRSSVKSKDTYIIKMGGEGV